jgi:iron complex transport system ATP-binding protein
LDEPTSALDPKHSVAIMKVLQRYIKGKKAALCVMHDINLALRFADKIALMKEGVIHCFCSSKEIDANILSYVFDVPWHIEEWQGGRLAVPL